MLILTAVSMLIQLLPEILAATGVVSPTLGKLIADLCAGLPALIQSIVAGHGATQDAINVLDGFQLELAAISKDISLSPSTTMMITSLSGSIRDAIAADQAARVQCDPANLGGLPTNLTTKG